MNYVLSNEQMRRADEYTVKALGYPSKALMQRAGKAIAEEAIRVYEQINARSVLVVCGNGNNGGDGYVCAQALLNRNFNVKVFCFNGKLSPDCAREKLNYGGEYSTEISADIIVDCIFGTGIARRVEGELADAINKINQSGSFVISADIPSGLNGDNGLVLGVAVKANLTVAIAEFKLGHFFNDGKDYCGKLIKKDIGISMPEQEYALIYGDNDIKNLLPLRPQNSHKGTFGSANLIAGSAYYGAAALSLSAALKSGCGYVYLTCKEVIKNALFPIYPQSVYISSPNFSADCIAVGMGLGCTEEAYKLTVDLLNNYQNKLIIDADALNAISRLGKKTLKEKKCEVLITPHIKEFSRLSEIAVDEILHNPVIYAKNFAKEYGVTVMLKSSVTVITDGKSSVINTRGSSALAKAGSGDMLSGLICGMAAQGKSLFDSAIIASYLLGASAEISEQENTAFATTSTEILNNLKYAFLRLTK